MAINQKPNIHNLIICTNAFIRKDGKYLMLKRSPLKTYAPNKIHPFGGKLDDNENPFEGAVREIREEVGVEITNLKLEAVILEIHERKDSPINWLIYHFSADYKSGEVIINEEGEVIYLTAEEIKKADLFPSVKSIIDNILNPQDGTVFTTNKYSEFEDGMTEISKNVCVI